MSKVLLFYTFGIFIRSIVSFNGETIWPFILDFGKHVKVQEFIVHLEPALPRHELIKLKKTYPTTHITMKDYDEGLDAAPSLSDAPSLKVVLGENYTEFLRRSYENVSIDSQFSLNDYWLVHVEDISSYDFLEDLFEGVKLRYDANMFVFASSEGRPFFLYTRSFSFQHSKVTC